MNISPTATFRPAPDIELVMPDQRLHKLRKAFNMGLAEYRASRNTRLARAAYEAAEAAKLAKFVRNCALTGHVEMSGF